MRDVCLLTFIYSDAKAFLLQRIAAAAAAKSLPSCPTLCDPIDSSPPGSSIPGILQARTLEWVAISFSGGKGRETESVNSTHHSVMNYMEKNLKRFTKPHERGSI